MFGNFRGKNFRVKIFSWSGGYHENLHTLHNYVEKYRITKGISVFAAFTKVSPLGPVNRPCAAGIAVEPFWPRSAVLRLHIYVDCTTCYYSLLKIFRVKIFSWFEPTTKIF